MVTEQAAETSPLPRLTFFSLQIRNQDKTFHFHLKLLSGY